ncbi:MAG: hypothetical protein KJ936_11550 [Proteobacteria bacterium]|nr:hypothetical protein [Pseudomonadota bacterium]MBU2228275.1 hypothetical protein [Pseudomonadota bacterium]MBU2262740.1 hypothetical protein [Pseudomonadota bacterium]
MMGSKRMRLAVLAMLCLAATGLATGQALAADPYPTRPIQVTESFSSKGEIM